MPTRDRKTALPARDPRRDFTSALDAIARAIVDDTPDLAALDARRVLFVPLSAHGTIAASVRGLDDVSKSVRVDGSTRTHEVGLRPPFFLGATASSRLTTIVHELLHIDPLGGLLDERRHARRPHAAHEAHARALTTRALSRLAPELLMPLGHEGEVLMRAWRVRPSETTRARAFTTRDLYWQPVSLETPRASRTSW